MRTLFIIVGIYIIIASILCPLYTPEKFMFKKDIEFTDSSFKRCITGTDCGYCYVSTIKGKNNKPYFNKLSSSKVLCFVLFVNDNAFDAIDEILLSRSYKEGYSVQLISEPLKIENSSGGYEESYKNTGSGGYEESYESILSSGYAGWFHKYVAIQVDKFKTFLENPDWSEYDILHFIDYYILNLPAPYIKDEKFYVRRDRTILTFIQKELQRYKNRYAFFQYKCDKFINPETGRHFNYFGSLVRFTSLVMPELDVVIFRDAHSTMPNPNNSIDSIWRDHWLSGTNKKYWIYNMINYNPLHTMGERTMFAASWGARKMKGDTSIFSLDLWNKSFGYLKYVDQNDFFRKATHGIDERILLLLSRNQQFLDESYIVGVTWLFWLFFPQHNPRTLSRYEGDKQDTDGFDLEKVNELKLNKTEDGVVVNTKEYSISGGIQTYYKEVICTIKYINELLQERKGGKITIDELWSNIEEYQGEKCDDIMMCELVKKLTNNIPPRNHFWEYIFDVDPKSSHMFSLSLMEYLESNKYFNTMNLDMNNICDVVKKYFVGGKFNYDKYDRELPIHLELPEDISLPLNHSMKN